MSRKNSMLLGLISLCFAGSVFAQKMNVENEIAVQMYTLRSLPSAEEQFATAHKAGFRHVELVGDHGMDARQLKAVLDKNQLTPTSSHIQLATLEQDYQPTVAFNKAIGNHMIIVPWIKPEDRPDSYQGWVDYAKKLDQIGARLRKDGMQLGYHNHNFEMKKYQGTTALDIILTNTRPENLKLEMDAAWVSRGGQDPVSFLKRYPGRIYAIHAKDNAGIGVRDDEMNFAPLGEGLLDWDSILPAAKASGVKWFIIEHDQPKDVWSVITTSHKNLRAELEKYSQ